MVNHLKGLANAIEEPYREYWAELGRFVHTFSETEQTLLSLLRHLAGVSDEIAGILFGGVRFDGAKDTINRIVAATAQTSVGDALRRPLAQFAAINTIRNNVIHWGAKHDGSTELLVTNAAQNPTADRLKEFRISPDDLRAMSVDLHKINLALVLLLLPSSSDEETFGRYLAVPWLYKPPQPNRPTKRQRAGHAPTQ